MVAAVVASFAHGHSDALRCFEAFYGLDLLKVRVSSSQIESDSFIDMNKNMLLPKQLTQSSILYIQYIAVYYIQLHGQTLSLHPGEQPVSLQGLIFQSQV